MKAVVAILLVLYLAASQGWKCTEGPRLSNVKQIDAGLGLVVAVSKYKRSYILHGYSWYSLGRQSVVHATVGKAGLWAVSSTNKVMKMVAGKFQVAKGYGMAQVDAGGPGHLAGVTPKTIHSYCLKDSVACGFYGQGSLAWTPLSPPLRYVSCGMSECWGVNQHYRPVMTTLVKSDTCQANQWIVVSGRRMKMIEVSSNGLVFGVGTDGKVWQIHKKRAGPGNVWKYGWKPIPMCMPISHLTYDLHHLWVVTRSGWLLKCTH